MVYIAAAIVNAQSELFSYSVAQTLLPSPVRATTIIMEVKRTCAAPQTDVLMSAARQVLRIDYKNDNTSVGALTVTPASGQFIDGLATYVLQPGDSATFVNTSGTNWSIE